MPKLHKVTQANITTAKGLQALPPSELVHYHKVNKGLAVGVYKPGTGTISWRARVRHEGRYRVETLEGVTTYAEAVTAATAFLERLNAGQAPTRAEKAITAKGQLTVRQLIEDYVDQDAMRVAKGDRYDEWAYTARRLSRGYVYPDLGEKRIARLDANDIRDLQVVLRRRVSAETVNRALVTLRAALNYALARGYIQAAFWKQVPLLEEAEAEDKARGKAYIDQADREAFLEAAGEHLAAICRCMYITGCRPSEARRLTVGDVHADGRLKQPYLRLRTFKGNRVSGTGRKFPLAGKRLDFFREQARGRDKSEPLFMTEKGLPWSMANLAKATKQVRGDLELESYTWRHCWIIDMIRANVQPLTVAKLCGTSLRFIQDNYTLGDHTLVDQLPEM
jgi:integrase